MTKDLGAWDRSALRTGPLAGSAGDVIYWSFGEHWSFGESPGLTDAAGVAEAGKCATSAHGGH